MRHIRTRSQIEIVAINNGLNFKTVIEGVFNPIEKIAVDLGDFRTALFIMNEDTFDFHFEKTYNAKVDKYGYRLPFIFND
jgi:hypothetical protein